jgi:glycosyltransferase involved in cell wall biosynthesis
MLTDEIRARREIIGELDSIESDHVVFIGLYNSAKFQGKIEKWLPSLMIEGVPLLVVDNFSSDGTWVWAKEVLRLLLPTTKVVFVRNPINLGGYGSLVTNLDLFKESKWVMTLHQDDEYDPEHLRSHIENSNGASNLLGMICSEATSVNSEGKRLGYPRGAWFLGPDPTAADIFIAHLKNHSYPFSGASFRTSMLREISIPWHSTAFPDTEIVLRALPSWSFKYLHSATVKYLENLDSESHVLSTEHRDFGGFLALVRVFRSDGFQRLSTQLDSADAELFAVAVHEALLVRIRDPLLQRLVQVVAQEAIIEFSGLSRTSARLLLPSFLEVGDSQAIANLVSNANFDVNHFQEAISPAEESGSQIKPLNSGSSQKSQRILIARFMGIFPPRFARAIYRLFLKLPYFRKRLPQWNFDWQPK